MIGVLDLWDLLVVAGLICCGVGLLFVWGWPALLVFIGVVMVVGGLAGATLARREG